MDHIILTILSSCSQFRNFEINNILTAQSDMFSIAKIYRQRNLPLECAHWMLHALNAEGGIDSDLIRDQASQLGLFTH